MSREYLAMEEAKLSTFQKNAVLTLMKFILIKYMIFDDKMGAIFWK